MRFSVFSAPDLQGPNENMPPCQSVLHRSRLEIKHNDLMIISIAYKLIIRKKKMKKRKHLLLLGSRFSVHSSKRTEYGCVECDLLTIAGAAQFMENPDQ